MTDQVISRRQALRLGGAAGLALGLAACGKGFGGGGGDSTSGTTLNMVWWGDITRANLTQAALDVFHRQFPGITIKTEYQDSTPYKDKLATRFAAGDPPDLMAMRLDSVGEYGGRGVLLDLNRHADALDLSPLSANVKGLGTVGAANYGVASGLNTIGFIVNKAVTDKYKVAIPDGNTWGWPDLAAFARELSAKTGRKIYGTGFEAYTIANLIVFTRQRGEDFYTADGKLGLTQGTLVAWFDMIEAMRREGGFPPAGFFEEIGSSADQSYIAKGTLASQIIPTNNFLSYNKACGGTLVLLRPPGETQGKRRGQSIDTPALWSISAKSKHPAETLKLLNFLINDAEGAKAAGTTRGVPANPAVASAIKAGLAPDDQVATDYLMGLQKETLPAPYVYPKGSSTLQPTLKKISTEVEFRRQSSAEGAKQFLTEAHKALGQ
ncbi:ABC transporter substrate-binding protein [Actinoplanes sp. CA-142083]|uniref:ABC transporter substrate-binding protein n=1 Tax=Actinoplanes sp. CA-142083 TaxID=3239903 RepID=UPI003D8A0CCF